MSAYAAVIALLVACSSPGLQPGPSAPEPTVTVWGPFAHTHRNAMDGLLWRDGWHLVIRQPDLAINPVGAQGIGAPGDTVTGGYGGVLADGRWWLHDGRDGIAVWDGREARRLPVDPTQRVVAVGSEEPRGVALWVDPLEPRADSSPAPFLFIPSASTREPVGIGGRLMVAAIDGSARTGVEIAAWDRGSRGALFVGAVGRPGEPGGDVLVWDRRSSEAGTWRLIRARALGDTTTVSEAAVPVPPDADGDGRLVVDAESVTMLAASPLRAGDVSIHVVRFTEPPTDREILVHGIVSKAETRWIACHGKTWLLVSEYDPDAERSTLVAFDVPEPPAPIGPRVVLYDGPMEKPPGHARFGQGVYTACGPDGAGFAVEWGSIGSDAAIIAGTLTW